MNVVIEWGQIAYAALALTINQVGDWIDRHPTSGYSCPVYCEVDHKHLPLDETLKEFIMRDEMRGNKQTQHDKNLESILSSTIFSVVDNIQVIAKEVRFYNNHQLIAEPDGMVWNGDTLYIIEYKCSDKHRTKAYKQLNTATEYVRNELNIYVPVQKIFACKKDQVEKVII